MPLLGSPCTPLDDMSGIDVEPEAPHRAGEPMRGGDARACDENPVTIGSIECRRVALSALVPAAAAEDDAGCAPNRVKVASGTPRLRGGVMVDSIESEPGLKGPSRSPLPGVEK